MTVKKDEKSPKQKSKRRQFTLEVHALEPGSEHPELAKIQSFLKRSGYLGEGYCESTLDDPTRSALKMFQQFRGVPPTGTTDAETVQCLMAPSCGYPDLPVRRADRAVEAALEAQPSATLSRGCDYRPAEKLTYRFLNHPSDPDAAPLVEGAVARAFASWAAVIPLDFELVEGEVDTTLKIGWFSNAHNDDMDFDGNSGDVAHAFPPPSCGEAHSGELHFDDDEVWGNGHDFGAGLNPRQFDIEALALHEIGHLLGLNHSGSAASTMFGRYLFIDVETRRRLSDDVVAAIQAIYGVRA
jgi:hypothetical protein